MKKIISCVLAMIVTTGALAVNALAVAPMPDYCVNKPFVDLTGTQKAICTNFSAYAGGGGKVYVDCRITGQSSQGSAGFVSFNGQQLKFSNTSCEGLGQKIGVDLKEGQNMVDYDEVEKIEKYIQNFYGDDGWGGNTNSGPGAPSECATILTGIPCGEDAKNGEGIIALLGIALTILTAGVGILATIGLVISGIQYTAARDNAAMVTKVKSRIFNIVIGLLAYGVMWVVLEWLIPGGIL